MQKVNNSLRSISFPIFLDIRAKFKYLERELLIPQAEDLVLPFKCTKGKMKRTITEIVHPCQPRSISLLWQLSRILCLLRLKDHLVSTSTVARRITGNGSSLTSAGHLGHVQSVIKRDIGLLTAPMSLMV